MTIAISVLAVLVGAFAQASAGTGLGLISGGILVVTLGREPSIVLLSLISIPMMAAILWQNHRDIQWKNAAFMTIPALIATPLLALGLRKVADGYLLVAAGVAVLMSVFFLLNGHNVARLKGKIGATGAGLLSAVMNMLSGSGGPPVAIYAVNAQWSPSATRGTLQIFFMGMSLASVTSLGIPLWDIRTVIFLCCAAVVGTVSGMLVANKLPVKAARLAILALAALGGCVMLGSGITSFL